MACFIMVAQMLVISIKEPSNCDLGAAAAAATATGASGTAVVEMFFNCLVPDLVPLIEKTMDINKNHLLAHACAANGVTKDSHG